MYGGIIYLQSDTPPDGAVFAALEASALPYLGEAHACR